VSALSLLPILFDTWVPGAVPEITVAATYFATTDLAPATILAFAAHAAATIPATALVVPTPLATTDLAAAASSPTIFATASLTPAPLAPAAPTATSTAPNGGPETGAALVSNTTTPSPVTEPAPAPSPALFDARTHGAVGLNPSGGSVAVADSSTTNAELARRASELV